jgi:integrase
MIILVGELSNIIDRGQAEQVESCPYVFHRHGIKIKHYNRAWRTAREKARLPSKLFHDSRRTAVWNMDSARVPRQTAKQLPGHKTDAVYNRYRIVNEQDIREGMTQTRAHLTAQNSGHHTDTDAIREHNHHINP